MDSKTFLVLAVPLLILVGIALVYDGIIVLVATKEEELVQRKNASRRLVNGVMLSLLAIAVAILLIWG